MYALRSIMKCNFFLLAFIFSSSILLAQPGDGLVKTPHTSTLQILSQDTRPGELSKKAVRLNQLLEKKRALELALEDFDTEGAWDYRLAESLMELATVQRELGYKQLAADAYRDALHNMRVNKGLYSANQLPIILDLMHWYLEEQDFHLADELGDWAAFILQRAYSAPNEKAQLAQAYQQLINLRLSAPRVQSCPRNWFYISCRDIRRWRGDHFVKAFELQKKATNMMLEHYGKTDPLVMNHLIQLAKISLITSEEIRRVKDGPYTRIRYRPGHYDRSFRHTMTFLQINFPQLDPELIYSNNSTLYTD